MKKIAWFTSTNAPVLRALASANITDNHACILIFSDRKTAQIKDLHTNLRIPFAIIDKFDWHNKHNLSHKDTTHRELYDQQVAQIVYLYRCDLIVCDEYNTLLSERILKEFKAINIHYGNLDPKKGPTQIGLQTPQTIDKQNTTTICIHQIDAGIDTGAILLQQTCKPQDRHKQTVQLLQEVINTYY